MDFFDLVNISERYLELINPSSPEKVIKLGKFLRLRQGSRVVDFGCGYAEPLILWAEQFGIEGIGIDVREQACERARKKVSERGLTGRIEIVCGKGADYAFEPGAFDAATCVGASFVWGGYKPTIQAMKRAIRPEGRLGIGEPYWLRDKVPEEYAAQISPVHTEFELMQIAREEGFDFEYVVRASHDDWDRYEADNWHGLIRWIEENPDHPELEDVIKHLHKDQDEYLKFGREYLGWAMYVLAPRRYNRRD
jgi:SAM-dependent methyltransferase